jgi:hypothetical protein
VPRRTLTRAFLLTAALTVITGIATAQTSFSGPPLQIARTAGTITVDGDLSDPGWAKATPIETWYETNPGDNTPPRVKSVGYIAYDDRFLYAGFQFDDPDPGAIRAPFTDRDNISGNGTDYGGIIIDTRNDGRRGVLLLVTPRNIQYDAASDDSSGEDSAPDYFWDSATRITGRGWTLEIRVPFSSLRYRNVDPQTWGLMLYRNYPRDFRYQMFSMQIPRGRNCFICNANTLNGLSGLPGGGHVVVAPYVSGTSDGLPTAGLGSPLEDTRKMRVGGDVKWTVDADNALDLTLKPDFSQIESDTAQISANERFALSFPEKRPFFLEGVELLRTPIQAVYTRAITAPRWGTRMTGKTRGVSYTALVADDTGGGSVVLPGPNGSSFAAQDFGSYVLVGRARRDVGRSFVSMLVTDREARDGNGHNRVAGPDFYWRPTNDDTITGQVLFSDTKDPNRPELSSQWTGRATTSHAADVSWNRSTRHFNSGLGYKDFGDDFRADVGFVPQVGYRETFHNVGWTVRPQGFARRVQFFVDSSRQTTRDGGELIRRQLLPGINADIKWSGFVHVRYVEERIRSGIDVFPRRVLDYFVRFDPSRMFSQLTMDGSIGREVDFANSRPATGGTINLSGRLNLTNHLELLVLQNQRWLDVEVPLVGQGRLFTARVSRVRSTYTFNAKSFTRVIAQYVSTNRDVALYTFPTPARAAGFTGSALFAYKINWQSVLFVGYGNEETLSDERRFEPAGRQFFVKISYAFQR